MAPGVALTGNALLRLQAEILPELDAFKGALRMEAVKAFADKIKQLGEEFRITQLSHFANQLHEYEESFDIDGIEKAMEDLPGIVDDLVSHSEAYDEQS